MEGRDRQGSDARGSVGDFEPLEESVDEQIPQKTKKAPASISRIGLGIGLAIIVVGIAIWIWPYVSFWILGYTKTLSTGPRFVVYGILLMFITVIADFLYRILRKLLF